MAKYSLIFKLKVVTAYLNSEGGYSSLAKKYGVKDASQVRRWVSAFKEFGKDGLCRKRNNTRYTSEFKLAVVESYLTSKLSYRRTFHSDRGWVYQMKAYQHNLKVHNIFQSMSRKGNCLDNSPMENFFAILKQEMYYGNTFHSYDELKMAIENYIMYYNTKRIKERLNWLSPIDYRLATTAA